MASSLARRDQENLVHSHQTAAAAKPLNQGVRGLAPKTPGNNNTLRRKQNDENATAGFQKGEKSKLTVATPALNLSRAPLGQKTTNAKARAFATPAPATGGLGKTHRRSASGKKTKLKIHHQIEPELAPTVRETEDEEPDIEICPPKVKDLPDLPDDDVFAPGKKFPQFEGENYSRGWYGLYANPIGDDGLSKYERDVKEEERKFEEDYRAQVVRDADRSWDAFNEEFEEARQYLSSKQSEPQPKPSSTTAATKPSTSKGSISTLQARTAALALSKNSQPRFAKSTASTRARVHGPGAPEPPSPASNSTIGYARGRQVSSTLKDVKAKDAADKPAERNIEDNMFVKEQRMLDELLQSDDTLGGLDDDIWKPSTGKDWFQEQLEQEFVMPHV